MLGRADTGSALGSGAVDADFWALVCEDEEWLDAEFDAIVGAAREALGGAAGSAGLVLHGPAAGCGDRDLPELSGRGGPGNGPADSGAGNGDRPEPVTTEITAAAEQSQIEDGDVIGRTSRDAP